MKNCEPFVSRPALAMERRPGPVWRSLKLHDRRACQLAVNREPHMSQAVCERTSRPRSGRHRCSCRRYRHRCEVTRQVTESEVSSNEGEQRDEPSEVAAARFEKQSQPGGGRLKSHSTHPWIIKFLMTLWRVRRAISGLQQDREQGAMNGCRAALAYICRGSARTGGSATPRIQTLARPSRVAGSSQPSAPARPASVPFERKRLERVSDLGDGLAEQAHHDPAHGLAAVFDIEVDLARRMREARFDGRMRAKWMQSQWPASRRAACRV